MLQGWQTIRKRHEAQVPGDHQEEDVVLQMQMGSQMLALSPLVTLKRCTICHKQDVFVFDSRKTYEENRHQVYFLDYLAGHKINRPSHLVEPLLAMAVPVPEARVAEEVSVGGDYAQVALDRLLQEKSVEAQYLSPGYLRTPLQKFIEDHDHGVFWLQAPAHLGKSIFVEGLLPEARLEKKPLVAELKVVAFHIRQEYRYDVALLKDYLTDMLKQALDVRGGKKELPDLALASAAAGAAFGQWLGQWLDIYQQVHRRAEAKLLVCLDGLDELVTSLTTPDPFLPRRGESRGVLEFVPVPDQIANGVLCVIDVSSASGLSVSDLAIFAGLVKLAGRNGGGAGGRDWVDLVCNIYFSMRTGVEALAGGGWHRIKRRGTATGDSLHATGENLYSNVSYGGLSGFTY